MTERFAMVPGGAIRDPRIDNHAFRVLALIGSYGANDGWMRASQGWIAEQLGVSRPLIHRCLKELEEYGYIFSRPAEKLGRGLKDYRTSLDRNNVSPVGHVTPMTCHADDVSRLDLPDLSHSVTPNNQLLINTTSSPSSEREEPSKNPSKVDWVARLNQAIELAGGSASKANGGTMHYADLRRLCEPAKGEPCDWELDVVPAIMSKAASLKAKGQSIGSWVWVEEGALRNRDRRLAGLPTPEAQPMRMAAGRSKESSTEKAARLMAAYQQERVAS